MLTVQPVERVSSHLLQKPWCCALWHQLWRRQLRRHRNQSHAGHLHVWRRPCPSPAYREHRTPAGEVMICWCYLLHLFVWTRRDRRSVPLPATVDRCPGRPGPSRSKLVISCTPDHATTEADPSQSIASYKILKRNRMLDWIESLTGTEVSVTKIFWLKYGQLSWIVSPFPDKAVKSLEKLECNNALHMENIID